MASTTIKTWQMPITTVYGTKESANKLGHLQSTQVADMVDFMVAGWWGMSRNPLRYESFGHQRVLCLSSGVYNQGQPRGLACPSPSLF